ncbi:P-loop containing nucleoside triphosphate hydrolase protein [Mycena rebaudengoi]|nr:P-loop containing nucleoside triphosphate hydrolase protein [Mycena rebaudengoi]
MLPPSPKIFHGREPELEKLVQTLMQDSARITILGTGGMGKTSLATAALHDPQVQAKYPCQYFVSCNSVPSCAEMVSTIAEHIQVEKGTHLAKRVAHYFTHAPPTLLVLDNLETPWEPPSSRAEVEEFLSLLTDVLHLGLLVTMRGAERPAKVKWSHPFLEPLCPLSGFAALQTFLDEADDFHEEDSVKNLLDLTGNLPLAVSLIASVASYEGCDKALLRWKTESTRMLSDGYDQRSSLDISIMLSFTSSRMTTGAQELLSALSMLPDGLTASELVQTQLAIPDILECRATLLQTSLAFVDKDQKLKVLTPIREHILSVHPPSSTLKLKLQQHFHEIITKHWIHFRLLNAPDILSQISQNLGNFNSVFLDGLNTEIPDGTQNIQSILFLNHFHKRIQFAVSPLLPHLSEHMLHNQNSPILGDYLIECFAASHMLPVEDAENRITFGNQYFSTKSPLEQGESILFHIVVLQH